jgi:hypothetical protein
MEATAAPVVHHRATALRVGDVLLLWLGLGLWIATFLLGTLVDSAPYRARLATLEGGLQELLVNGAAVVVSYTLTNVAILCILAGLLGTLGAKARLGSDSDQEDGADTTSPRNSAALRGFLVYLCLIAGVLILCDDPAAPTQKQYVRLAGIISLAGFVVNYRPALFGRLLQKAGGLLEGGKS